MARACPVGGVFVVGAFGPWWLWIVDDEGVDGDGDDGTFCWVAGQHDSVPLARNARGGGVRAGDWNLSRRSREGSPGPVGSRMPIDRPSGPRRPS